ncbi:MAG: hypothetical protein VB017_02365 [Endomicrobiaceae bacterium]|nr:hypothetical protein [Endomicrobiaceae bacterium]
MIKHIAACITRKAQGSVAAKLRGVKSDSIENNKYINISTFFL